MIYVDYGDTLGIPVSMVVVEKQLEFFLIIKWSLNLTFFYIIGSRSSTEGFVLA